MGFERESVGKNDGGGWGESSSDSRHLEEETAFGLSRNRDFR